MADYGYKYIHRICRHDVHTGAEGGYEGTGKMMDEVGNKHTPPSIIAPTLPVI